MSQQTKKERYILSWLPFLYGDLSKVDCSSNFRSMDGAGHTCTPTSVTRTIEGGSFDGTNSYISTPAKITAGLSELTMWAWVKPTDESRNHHVLSDYTADGTTSAILAVHDVAATGTWQVAAGLKGATTAWNYDRATTTTLVYGGGYLIGFSWEGTTRTFYVNGLPDGTAAYSDTALLAAPANNLAIGRQYADATLRFSGLIQEYGILPRAMPPTWWSNLYKITRK